MGENNQICEGFANTASASVDCNEFVDQPCKCGDLIAEVGKVCNGAVITDLVPCSKMYPSADSLTEACKCGSEQCGKGKFCYNKETSLGGGDAGSVCLKVVEGKPMTETGVCKAGSAETATY